MLRAVIKNYNHYFKIVMDIVIIYDFQYFVPRLELQILVFSATNRTKMVGYLVASLGY